MNGFKKSASIMTGAAVLGVGALVVQPRPVSAETETGDRPEIIVPRAGGRAAFEKFGCIMFLLKSLNRLHNSRESLHFLPGFIGLQLPLPLSF